MPSYQVQINGQTYRVESDRELSDYDVYTAAKRQMASSEPDVPAMRAQPFELGYPIKYNDPAYQPPSGREMFTRAATLIPAVAATGAAAPLVGSGVSGAMSRLLAAFGGGAVGEGIRQGVTGEDLNLPAMATTGLAQGAAPQAVGELAPLVKAGASRLMQSALKPTQAVLKEYRTTPGELSQTLLGQGINVTQAGLTKLQQLFDANNAEIRALVQQAPNPIDTRNVAARVLPTAAKMGQQVNPASDLKAVGDTVDEFLQHPVYSNPLSVAEAQDLKVGTYRQIGKKYGQVAPASIEAQKALARGLKEEIATAVPEVEARNIIDTKLMAAMDSVGRRVAQAGNRDPVGFAWVAQNPVSFIAALMDRGPTVKSLLARGMWGPVAELTGVSPKLIRAAVVALAESGPSTDSLDRGPVRP